MGFYHNLIAKLNMENKGEIILYQPNEEVRLEVRLENETVWLTQAQMAELFQTTPQNVTMHIRAIYIEEELEEAATCKESLQVRQEGKRMVRRTQKFYNLDVIISVGYRVKSKRGVQFRQWANQVLKEYLLRGYSINQRLNDMEQRMDNKLIQHELRLNRLDEKMDFFVRTSLPPVEGVFFEGQIFDAYKLAADLVRSAKESLVLIDNYVDESVLTLFTKRQEGAKALIYTQRITPQFRLDLERHNAQYPPVEVKEIRNVHDRFLILDQVEVYHIGASLKDLGKKLFAFSRLHIPVEDVLRGIENSEVNVERENLV